MLNDQMKNRIKSKPRLWSASLFFVTLLLICTGGAVFAEGIAKSSFTASLGVDFLNYQHSYLSTQAAYVREITDTLEFELGAAFGIRVEEQEPGFFLPFHAGFGFVFPNAGPGEGVIGIGLTPAFNWGAGIDETRFYLGPHLKAALRLPIHPYMQWQIEVQQNLHIGPPKWINTSTRVMTGVKFFFSDSNDS